MLTAGPVSQGPRDRSCVGSYVGSSPLMYLVPRRYAVNAAIR